MLHAIRWYQRRISPQMAPRCKYYPTCSQYAVEAINRFGACRGVILAAFRLLRCRPWSNGGIDDVPQHFSLLYRCSWSKAHEEPRLTATASDKEIA
ncbi:membrane protein insertion efficiency factor YidD [Bifidobacterium aquikefiricola]|uniref:Putative membrane protein insertion efficiency factor n=1 Tax=Bifidobacterium aquikefiricola TaxID=3059038 RepID=A0AB39U963_9BIFI